MVTWNLSVLCHRTIKIFNGVVIYAFVFNRSWMRSNLTAFAIHLIRHRILLFFFSLIFHLPRFRMNLLTVHCLFFVGSVSSSGISDLYTADATVGGIQIVSGILWSKYFSRFKGGWLVHLYYVVQNTRLWLAVYHSAPVYNCNESHEPLNGSQSRSFWW